jgi:hypothetical protein
MKILSESIRPSAVCKTSPAKATQPTGCEDKLLFATSNNLRSFSQRCADQALHRRRLASSSTKHSSLTIALVAVMLVASAQAANVLHLKNAPKYYTPVDPLPQARVLRLSNNTGGTDTTEHFDTGYSLTFPEISVSFVSPTFNNNSDVSPGTVNFTNLGFSITPDDKLPVGVGNLQNATTFAVSDMGLTAADYFRQTSGILVGTSLYEKVLRIASILPLEGIGVGVGVVMYEREADNLFQLVKYDYTSGVTGIGTTPVSSLSAPTKEVPFWSVAFNYNYKLVMSFYNVNTGAGRSEIIYYHPIKININAGNLVTRAATITDANLHVNYTTSDNLNSDHIYFMIQDHASTIFKVGVTVLSTFTTDATSYSAAFSSTTYNTLTRGMKFLNAGTQAYMIGVP